MNIEFTGRQYEVTPAVRKQVQNGLQKLTRVLGQTFDSHVVLTTEKHRHIAEITVKIRNNSLVGVAEAPDMIQAVGEAMDKIDRQAVKYKTRVKGKKRIARKARATSKWNGGSEKHEETHVAVGASESTAVDVLVHSFPGKLKTREAHVIKSDDSVAMRPMTLEEAVKEAEFRDRDVFVFRDAKGQVKVLHRTRDGKMELIEVP